MSLLYECINGVIQGGILKGTDGAKEEEEIASLCVEKLRGMIVIEGDPNRTLTRTYNHNEIDSTAVKYVALLAFNKIVLSHPHLISMQQDVIMGCIDDPDISIRLQALDLGTGMVGTDNIVALVERLMRQLRSAPVVTKGPKEGRNQAFGVEPAADSDGEDPEETLQPTVKLQNESVALPTEYRTTIMHRILDMCSKDTYSNVTDFEWYIDILIKLVKLLPTTNRCALDLHKCSGRSLGDSFTSQEIDVSNAIGWELRNVAVRVSTVRAEAVKAAESLLSMAGNEGFIALKGVGGEGVLTFVAWIVGEYAESSVSSCQILDSLIHSVVQSLSPVVISAYLQAIPKVLASIVSQTLLDWNPEHKSMMFLLVARVIHFLEPLAMHPSLEVQERSVELLELMRVAFQAITGHGPENDRGPLLLTQILPQLFTGVELNAVAPTAQRKVPLPHDLHLEVSISNNLSCLLQRADQGHLAAPEATDFDLLYTKRPIPRNAIDPALDTLPSLGHEPSSYQQTGSSVSNLDALMRKRYERREKIKDDPFYIGNDDLSSGTSTPFQEILRSTNDDDIDIATIPIMDLDLGNKSVSNIGSDMDAMGTRKQKRKRPKRFDIAKDENIEQGDPVLVEFKTASSGTIYDNGPSQQARDKPKKSLLQADSSGLGNLVLNVSENATEPLDVERQEAQDAEMATALAEVERLRLEMQRASERIHPTDGAPAEGIMVKKKKKKKKKIFKEPARNIEAQYGDIKSQSNGDPIQGSQDAEASPTIKKQGKKRYSTVAKPDEKVGYEKS